jgi:hypothetical protein
VDRALAGGAHPRILHSRMRCAVPPGAALASQAAVGAFICRYHPFADAAIDGLLPLVRTRAAGLVPGVAYEARLRREWCARWLSAPAAATALATVRLCLRTIADEP